MVAAQEQALGIFADATLKLALHVQQAALDTEDLDRKVRLAGAFHRLGRGLRQTLALSAGPQVFSNPRQSCRHRALRPSAYRASDF